MKYIQKVKWFVAVLLFAVMGLGMTMPAMAQGQDPVTPPKIVTLAPVGLTSELREKYSEQTILVRIKATITETGTMDSNIQVITSSGDAAFDQAVIDSIQQSVFTPAYTGDQQAIASSIVLPLNIKVEKYLPEEEAVSQAGDEQAPDQ
ncbi:energy transducer TonB [Sporomusa termitida]|uniref:TonB C-terminal domain-containing protein n=1 Tax=Sporomusa termitida TaxID=2377 RepID=A0A517E042_9FIRM|nr:energy transducer TonB [Sporomusa termitida]QDR82972.1 hypothetical protein SPTER_44250 [Sporomusa termitida]